MFRIPSLGKFVTAVALAILLFFAVAIVYVLITPEKGLEITPTPKQSSVLRIQLLQRYSKKYVEGAVVEVYDSAKNFIGKKTTEAEGYCEVSYNYFYEGKTYYVLIYAGNSTVYEFTVTLTATDYDENTGKFGKTFTIEILPVNVTLTMLDPDMDKISDGGFINITSLGKTKFDLQWIVKNPHIGYGFQEVDSKVLERVLEVIILIRVQGAASITDGATKLIEYGTNDVYYYVDLLTDDQDALDAEEETVSLSGSITFDCSSLSENATITVQVYALFSTEYFKDNNGKLNTEAVKLAETSFIIGP